MIVKCILQCIANNFQPPQNFAFPETELSLVLFALKGFHGFVILAWWEDGTYCLLSSNFFGHKNESSRLEVLFLLKIISNMAESSKNIQKASKYSRKNTQKGSSIMT